MQDILERIAVGRSLKGRSRSINEDYYMIDPSNRYMIIADGMGGHYGGSIASRIAGETLAKYLDSEYQSSQTNTTLLEAGFRHAHREVLQAKESDDRLNEMGATLLALLIRPSNHGAAYTLANIGDSRLYSLQNHEIRQETRDDTVIQQAIDLCQISVTQAYRHPLRHVLSQCVGQRDSYPLPSLKDINLESGDIVIMCTDGAYHFLEPGKLAGKMNTKDFPIGNIDLVVVSILDHLLDIMPNDDATSIVVGFRDFSDSADDTIRQ